MALERGPALSSIPGTTQRSNIGDRFNSPSRSEISRRGLASLQVVCVRPRDLRGCAEAPACARGMARARLAPIPDPSPGPGQTLPDPGMYTWWSSTAQGTPLAHRRFGMARRAEAGGPRSVVGTQLTHTTYYAFYRSMGGRPPWQPLCPAPPSPSLSLSSLRPPHPFFVLSSPATLLNPREVSVGLLAPSIYPVLLSVSSPWCSIPG